MPSTKPLSTTFSTLRGQTHLAPLRNTYARRKTPRSLSDKKTLYNTMKLLYMTKNCAKAMLCNFGQLSNR